MTPPQIDATSAHPLTPSNTGATSAIHRLAHANTAVKAAAALAPGVVITGLVAAANVSAVVAGAPLFAIGTLGAAAVIMGGFVRADRRQGQ
jgi:hypothetical protein